MSTYDISAINAFSPRVPLAQQAERIAPALQDALESPALDEQQRDLALARALGARDFNTAAFSGSVRNVLPLEGFPPGGPGLEQLAELIAGRDFIAIAHARGSQPPLSLILNDHDNPQNPNELAIWRNNHLEMLMEGSLHDLIISFDDRVLLGPLTRQRAREIRADAPCYHEYPSREQFAIHALNAMIGRAVFNKALLDKLLIDELLESTPGKAAGITKDDFHLNTPRNEVAHLCDFENGLRPYWLMRALRRAGVTHRSEDEDEFILPGIISFFGAQSWNSRHAGSHFWQLLQFVEEAEREAQGLVVCERGRFIAFVKAAQDRWFMVDSTRDDQPRLSASDYLKAGAPPHDEDAPTEIIAWRPAA